MQKTIPVRDLSAPSQTLTVGKPSIPSGRQPVVERKFSDPSSSPKGERYPIPTFYERRIKPREHDPL